MSDPKMQMQNERNLMAAILDTVDALVIVLDPEGRIVRFNRACEDLTGYRAQDVMGKMSWALLVPAEEQEPVRAVIAAATPGSVPVRHENHWVSKDGQQHLISFTNTALRNPQGEIDLIVGTGIDITEKRIAEKALAQSHESLKEQVEERTHELQDIVRSLRQEVQQREKTEDALKFRLEFESLITTISSRFISMGLDEIDQGIDQALMEIGRFIDVDRSYVFLYSTNEITMDCTHEWCAEGIEAQIEQLKCIAVDELKWSNGILLNGQILHIPDVDMLPLAAASEKEEFIRQNIRSLMVVPMVYRGKTMGFLGFDAVREQKTWTQDSIILLQLVGQVFVNALLHKNNQYLQAGQNKYLEMLATGSDIHDTLCTLLRTIESQWQGMQGLVLLLDKDGRRLHYGAPVSLPKDYLDSIEDLVIGPMVGSCGTASYLKQRVIVEDIESDPKWDGLRDLAVKYGLRACWSEPVLSTHGKVLGTFAMYYGQKRSPSEAELETIEMAAHLVSIALEQKQAQDDLQEAYQTLEKRVDERTLELAALLEISRKFTATLEFEPLLSMVLKELKQAFKINAASIMMLEQKRFISQALDHTAEDIPDIQIEDSHPFFKDIIKKQKPQIINDLRSAYDPKNIKPDQDNNSFHALYSHYQSWMGVPLIAKEAVVGVINLFHQEQGHFSQDSAEFAAAFANQVAVAMENARFYEAEQAQLEDSEQRRKVAEVLGEILSEINSNTDLNMILTTVTHQAEHLLGAKAAAIFRYDEADNTMHITAANGLTDAYIERMVIPIAEGVIGQSAADKRIVAIPDWDMVYKDGEIMTQDGESIRITDSHLTLLRSLEDRFGAVLALPLYLKQGLYGGMVLYYERARHFEQDEFELAVMLSDHVVLAIENDLLLERAEDAAAAAERNRLARELHDSVSQALYGIGLGARTARTLLDREEIETETRERLVRPIDYVLSLADAGLTEMRSLIFELRPDALEKEGLVGAIKRQVESIRARHKINVSMTTCEEPDLALKSKEALYRTIQEGLNNIIKHAQADHIELYFCIENGCLVVKITDNGVGFDPERSYPGHLGLKSMHERIEKIGGELNINSKAGQGTSLHMRVAIK